MVCMDLLQHCAIAAVLYNKPSLSLTTHFLDFFVVLSFFLSFLSPRVTMCLSLTLGLIHCDLWFVKTSYKRATPRSRVCIVVHRFSDRCDLNRAGSDSFHKAVKCQSSHPLAEHVRSRKPPYVTPGCELVCWYGGLHCTAHVPAVVSYHKPSCQSLSIGHHL